VQTIVIASTQWKETVADICKQYDLSKKMVDDVLGFYSAHKKIVDALIVHRSNIWKICNGSGSKDSMNTCHKGGWYD
jgi:hypothetical protein